MFVVELMGAGSLRCARLVRDRYRGLRGGGCGQDVEVRLKRMRMGDWR